MAINIKFKSGLRGANYKKTFFVSLLVVLLISSLPINVFTPKAEGQTDVFTVTVNKSFAEPSGAGEYSTGTVITLNAGTRAGYTFSHWAINSGSVSLSSATGTTATFTMPANNVVITASWTVIQYSISYTLNGGSVAANPALFNANDPSTYNAGNPSSYNAENSFPITITNPTRTNYEFAGWDVTYANGTQKPFQISYSIPEGTTGNIALSANWKDPNAGKKFTVITDDAHGTPTGTGSYYVGDTVTINAGTQDGYTFSHWEVKDGSRYLLPGVHTSTMSFAMPARDVEILAIWKAVQYKIIYELKGGKTDWRRATEYPTTYAYSRDGYSIDISDPTRKDDSPLGYEYKFLDWTVIYPDGSSEHFRESLNIPAGTMGDITLEANWASKGLVQNIKDSVVFIAEIIGYLLLAIFFIVCICLYLGAKRDAYNNGYPVTAGFP